MPTDREREALERALQRAMGYGGDSSGTSTRLVRAIEAAGWMPRPEPGSPEEVAMVERMLVAETRAVCGDPDCCPEEYDDWDRSIATAVLRAALIPGDQA